MYSFLNTVLGDISDAPPFRDVWIQVGTFSPTEVPKRNILLRDTVKKPMLGLEDGVEEVRRIQSELEDK